MSTSTQPQQPVPASAAESTRAAQIGSWLFRKRSWLPVPLVLVALLAPGTQTAGSWAAGLALVAVGELVRLWGVATAGTETRRRSRTVHRLVRHGPFGWCRNPLYVGNFLLWLGFVAASGVLWFMPVAALVFALEYTYIVRWEEGVLESHFGDDYLAYKREVPRWFPRPPSHPGTGEVRWGESFRSEISTFLQFAAIFAAFALKERYWGDLWR